MSELLPFIRLFLKQFKWMVFGTFLSFVAVIASIGLLSLSGWFISATGYVATVTILVAQQFNYFYPAAGVRAFSVLRIISRYGERVFTHEATFKILTDVRVWVYAKLTPLAPAHFMRYRSGDLLNRFVNDVNNLDNLYIRIISPTIVLILAMIAMGIFFSFISIKVAASTVILAAIAGFFVPVFTDKMSRKTAIALANEQARLKSAITQHIQSMPELKIFAAQETSTDMLYKQNDQVIQKQQKLAFFTGAGAFLMTLLLGLTIWLGVWFSVGLVHKGQLNGAFIALIALGIMGFFEAILPLPIAYQYLGKTLTSAKRLLAVVKQKPTVVFAENTQVSLSCDPVGIEFKNVSFGYDKRHLVLKNFSLDIKAKQKLAICGPTGSGKTTIAHLLSRFWEPQEGEIMLGGCDITLYTENQLRSLITIISQNAHIFNGTIAENLKLAKQNASEQQMYQALQAVDLVGFVKSLPDGLNTWTGEYGKHLSKGQQKRLSLARAFLTDAPVLLLDEPTEGLDKITENNVFNALKQLMKNKTVILITHNLRLAKAMDRVVYFS
ncbi:thiol reductant ABC exporter subunit CydC [Facilibium subflavum]|uniref:thiol reductant ABC exporter subunit CydC n=1 Tax=Facilibium subflavum TaxID=2219058 RepID=UPI000E65BE7F|nr:thiol reductant ABC exporter subunit CydC [Facilibium subflavum]